MRSPNAPYWYTAWTIAIATAALLALFASIDPLLAWLVGANISTFAMYGVDKWAAQRGSWRVPERLLQTMTLLGGTPAAFAAQRVFRHKTRKASFQLWFIMTIVAHGLIVALYFWLR